MLRAERIALTPTDARVRPLAWSRIALGTLFLVRTTFLFTLTRPRFEAAVSPLLGWSDDHFGGVGLYLLPSWLNATACIVRTAAALLFLLGIRTRVSGMVAGVLGYAVLLQHPFGIAFTLHLLFQGAIILALTDAGCSLAVRPDHPKAPESSVLLVRCFLASIYFWAAVGKLRPDWLDGRTLALFDLDGAFRPWASQTILAAPVMRAFCSVAVVVVELALPFLLLLKRTQRWGLTLALILHATIELAAGPDLLGWEMAALLLSLWPPSAFATPEPSVRGSAY
jgi:hypothetical protein